MGATREAGYQQKSMEKKSQNIIFLRQKKGVGLFIDNIQECKAERELRHIKDRLED